MKNKQNLYTASPADRLLRYLAIAALFVAILFSATIVVYAQDVDFYRHKGMGKNFRQKADKREIKRARQMKRFNFRLNDTLTAEMQETNIYSDVFTVETRTHGKRAVNRGRHFYSNKRFGSITITTDDKVNGVVDGVRIDDSGAVPDSVTRLPFEPEEAPMLPPDAAPLSDLGPVQADPTVQPGQWPVSCKVVRLYVEVTFPYYKACGSDVQKTTDAVTGAFAQVAALYLREGIQIKLYKIKIWDVQDPYSTVNSLSLMLLNFANTEGPKAESKNYDLGSLIDLSTATRSYGGLAYVNGLNNPAAKYNAQCLYTSYTSASTYSWTVGCWAHELGHNFGSKHTQWCGWPGGRIDSCASGEPSNGVSCGTVQKPRKGTIMSYCHIIWQGSIDLNLGFGPLPGAAIRAGLAASNVPCIGTPPPACLWTYGPWTACVNGVQTRMVTSSPTGCTGTPPLPASQTCTIAPPPVMDGVPGAVTMSVKEGKSWFSFPIATDAQDWQYEVNYCSYDGKTPPDSASKPKACSIRNRFNFTRPTAAQLAAAKIELLADQQPMTRGLWYKAQVRYRKGPTGAIQTKNSGWSVW